LAAGFAVLVASMALWVRFDTVNRSTELADRGADDGGPSSLGQPADSALHEPATVGHHDASAATTDSYDASSQWLASLPSEPAIVRVDTRFAVMDLEDRIAWLDDVLTSAQLDGQQAAHIVALRRERAQLVDSLAQVRYAETLAAGLP
jgi:hypothetical protein